MHTFQMQEKSRDIFVMDYSDPFEQGEANLKQKQLLHMAFIAVMLFYRKCSDEAKMSLTKTKKEIEKKNPIFSCSCQI